MRVECSLRLFEDDAASQALELKKFEPAENAVQKNG